MQKYLTEGAPVFIGPNLIQDVLDGKVSPIDSAFSLTHTLFVFVESLSRN